MVVMATSLELPQPNFTAFICANRATNPEKFAKIGRALCEILGPEPVLKTVSSFGN